MHSFSRRNAQRVNNAMGPENPEKTLSRGSLMYLGVLLGGSGKIKTPWRWGYGWAGTFDANTQLSRSQREEGIHKITLWIIISLEEDAAEKLNIEDFHLSEIRAEAFQKLLKLSRDNLQDPYAEEDLVSTEPALYK